MPATSTCTDNISPNSFSTLNIIDNIGKLVWHTSVKLWCQRVTLAQICYNSYSLSFRYKANKYKWVCLAISWCIFIIVAGLATFGSTPSVRCALFPFVLAADTFCCLSILKALKKPPPGDRTLVLKAKINKSKNSSAEVQKDMEERRGGAASSESKRKQENNSLKKKALITIVIIQFVLTLNYVPFIITMSLETKLPSHTLKCQLTPLALSAAYSCTYLQPLLYLKSLGKLPCKKPKNM